MSDHDSSRRRFLQTSVIAGVSVWLAPFGSPAYAALFEGKLLTPIAWNGTDGSVRFRIDGIAKATGAKIFARDVRARDLPHWPPQQAHAFVLRVTKADRTYEGYDLSRLGADLQPDRIVTAEDLARDGLTLPAFYGEDMLLPSGRIPSYLGHAVAILIYHDFARFRVAKDRLKFHDEVLRYGEAAAPLSRDPWGSFRYVRVGGATPYDDDVYSSLKDSPLFPGGYRKQQPVWPAALPGGSIAEEGMAHAARIGAGLDQPSPDTLVFARDYATQSVDTAALEPDNANGWYDASGQTLHLVVATQSPQEVMEAAAAMVARSKLAVQRVFLHPCYTVGYGSKDHHNMPFYGLVAALYGDGRPVRLANDRYEQFQTSLKRHAFNLRYRIAVDRQSGKFKAIEGRFECNGGGRCNFSPSVALVAATAAQSIYYFPQNDISSTALASRAIDAGSARGYGTLQSMAATEMAVDEIATELGLDAIELRQRNVLKSGMKNTQGAIPAGALRADEVLEKARAHPLWSERVKRKTDYEAQHPGRRYGVGFGCTHKDFGTGAEACFARIELAADGRIRLWHTGTEIGTGMSTSQVVICAQRLGRPADEAHFSVTDWHDLPLVSSGDPWTMPQAEMDKALKNPRWSPSFCSPSSASNSAYYFSHGTSEAARLIFEHGLWPAALALWTSGFGGGQAAPLVVRREDARWVDGKLTCSGMQPLALAELAKQAHVLGLVTGAIVHTFNRWQWAEADWEFEGTRQRLPVDGIALQYGSGAPAAKKALMTTPGGFHVLDRKAVHYPPTQRNNAGVTYYSAVGTLAEIAVEIASGKVDLLSLHSIMECGNQIVPQLVSGQLQGGIAMGVGHALHEFLPLYEDGPGNGTWNFNRYHLPRGSDVAVWKQTSEVLPPFSPGDPPKGMAEVTMIPVVAAIVNGIAHAIDHRFTALPVTPEQIREVLA